jgi:predicted enzyme related to lactoylglutathione lyase
MLQKNVINWFQIPTLDLKRAAKFYSTILGVDVAISDFNGSTMGFFPMVGGVNDSGVGGCLMSPIKDDAPSKVGTTVFLACDGQLDVVISKVVSAGGKILMPKTHIGDPGYMAVIEDSEGNRVGLHSWK